ncbi:MULTISPECIES: lysozyme inhibitor LprI family protein [Cupriavidus]
MAGQEPRAFPDRRSLIARRRRARRPALPSTRPPCAAGVAGAVFAGFAACPRPCRFSSAPGFPFSVPRSLFSVLPMKKTLSAALLLAVSLGAQAGERPLSARYAACMNGAGITTAGMHDCIAAETARQDTALNAAYKRLQQAVAPARKTALLEAQRAWLAFRDANCRFRADPDGGTLAGLGAASCVMQMTADRAQELRDLAADSAL